MRKTRAQLPGIGHNERKGETGPERMNGLPLVVPYGSFQLSAGPLDWYLADQNVYLLLRNRWSLESNLRKADSQS